MLDHQKPTAEHPAETGAVERNRQAHEPAGAQHLSDRSVQQPGGRQGPSVPVLGIDAARLHARRLARHLREVGRERQLPQPVVQVALPPLQQGVDAARLGEQVGPRVAGIGQAPAMVRSRFAWLKSMKMRSPRSSFHQFMVTLSGIRRSSSRPAAMTA